MMDMYDVAVIGAGPVGSFVARELAGKGFDVALIEEHREIGKPVQCAGIITPRAFDITGKRRAVLNSVRGARIHAPDGTGITVEGKGEKAVVIDRALFDRLLGEDAIRNGADLLLGTRVKKIERVPEGGVTIEAERNGERLEIKARVLVGADGLQSITARELGLPAPKRIFSAFELETEEVETPDEYVDIFLGKEIAPEFFAWIIPTGDGGGRVGLAAPDRAHLHFSRLKRHPVFSGHFNPNRTYHYMAGGIPVCPPTERTYTDRGIIVGDAAAQVKATSGGGIYMGLKAGVHAVKALEFGLEKDRLGSGTLEMYEKGWKADIGKELTTDYKLHKIMASLSDEQINQGMRMLARDRVLKVIEQHGDIDYPSRLVLPLIRAEPGFLRFGGKVLRGMLG